MPARARFSVLAACFLWAVSFIATKEALESAPPLTVVTLRLLMAAVCFIIWMVASPRARGPVNPRHWPRLLILSLCGAGLHYSVQTMGLQYTTATNASLYAITAPITILLLGALFLDERMSVRKAVGVTVAILGVLTVMGLDVLLAFEWREHLLGDLLVLASIVMWGLFTVLGKKLTDELGALRITALVTLIGAAYMLPVGWVEMSLEERSLASISIQGWLALGFLGVGCCFLAVLLYFVALERSESQKVGVYLYTIPPMTALFAALYLGETLSWSLLAGSLLVYAGVYLTER